MKNYTFKDFEEEIRNEQDEKLKADFYAHWGKPFTEIVGLEKDSVKNPEFRRELKQQSLKNQWQERQIK